MKKQEKEPFLDRVLLHSKNADERLFDMVLRFITFVILIIIIWIYADLTHAKASSSSYLDVYLMGDNNLGLNPYFNDYDWGVVHNEYPDTTPYYTNAFSFVDAIPGHVVLTSDIDYESNYIAIGRTYWSYQGSNCQAVLMLPKDVVDNNNVFICNNGMIYSDVSFDCSYVWINKRDSENTNLYELENINIPIGYTDIAYQKFGVINQFQFYWYLSNIDYLSADSLSEIEDYLQNGESQNCFNANYLLINNLIESPNNEEAESNLNHLYFEDVQIGLTGQASNQDITSAEVVVGVSVDDWVLNHINDFYVNIAYNVHMKDSLTGTPDPDFTIHKIVPLKAFMNDGYVYSIYDLFQEGNFISYYNNIRSTYNASVVSTDGWINSNAIIPTLLRNASYVFTDYFVRTVESQNANYSIFDFGLDVTVQLSSGALGGTNNMSYPYTKAFDFLNGSSSITSAEGLRNHNPWLGETTPQANPLVPQGNNDIIGGGSYGGGNTSVNVNVSGQKIPMNVQTQQEINNTLTNYTNAFTTFSNSIRSLADSESQNNFYAVLSNTVPMIPGINIYLQYVALTCGVMLILLVLKILLF